jgi:hypothetical protein
MTAHPGDALSHADFHGVRASRRLPASPAMTAPDFCQRRARAAIGGPSQLQNRSKRICMAAMRTGFRNEKAGLAPFAHYLPKSFHG